MDDELQQLEDELRRLRPSCVPDTLCRALEGRLARSGRGRAPSFLVFAGVALPVAAAIAVIFAWTLRENEKARDERRSGADDGVPAVADLKPVAAESVLLGERDEGYVAFADGTPARRWRQLSVDRITWKDASTNASLTWTVPREEVRIVPVSFQ